MKRIPLPFSLLFAPLFLPSAAAAQDLLITSWNNNSVIRYDGTTGAFVSTLIPNGSGTLNLPHSARWGPDGNLYVTSFGNDKVLRYDDTGAFIDEFVPAGSGGLDGPTDALFAPDGDLYVSSFNTPGVLKYDGQTGDFIEAFVESGGSLQFAESMEFGPDGNLYLANGDGDNVLRYDGTTGDFIDVFASGQALKDPHTVAFRQGDMYVTAFEDNKINRHAAQTGAFVEEFVGPGNNLVNPHGLVFRGGFLYVASFGRDRILRYDAATGDFVDTFVTDGLGGLDGPISITFFPEPNSIVSYGCGVNPNGSLTVSSGSPSLGSDLDLGLDNPGGTQPVGSLPLVLFALNPDPAFPCGTSIAGYGMGAPGTPGELLIELGPTSIFLAVFGAPWAGAGLPASHLVSIPDDPALLGFAFYAQGALLDPTGISGIQVGLTEALEATVGF